MEANSIQPEDTGQGAEESSGGDEQGFVDTYLNDVPEDYRPHVEPYLRDIERNANERFERAAEYRKQWEPYEQLGVNDYEPEQLEQLLQFAQLAQDPEAFRQWWQQIGEQGNYFEDVGLEDDDDYEDEFDEDGEESGITAEDIANIVAQTVDQRLQPIQQEQQQRSQIEQVQQADKMMTDHMSELLDGEELEEAAQRTIWRFAYAHADEYDDPRQVIEAAMSDYEELVGDIESAVVERKANVPGPPLSGTGPANTNSEPPKDWNEAEQIAKERLAQQSGL